MEHVDVPADTTVSAKHSRLNPAVAIAVALLATFMGVCKVVDDNIAQAMQQATADKIDHWAFYQARNLREEVGKAALMQLRLQMLSAPARHQAAYGEQISAYETLVKEQARKKAELKLLAEKDQVIYDALSFRDSKFGLSTALITIAISLLAVTSLAHLWWLFGLSMVPAGFGIIMGIVGFFG